MVLSELRHRNQQMRKRHSGAGGLFQYRNIPTIMQHNLSVIVEWIKVTGRLIPFQKSRRPLALQVSGKTARRPLAYARGCQVPGL
jgi:hypothetical protein